MFTGFRTLVRLAAAIALWPLAVAEASNVHSAAPDVVSWRHNAVTGDVNEVAVSPDGAHVYTASYRGIGTFARNPITDELVLVDQLQHNFGVSESPLLMSPDGAHVYAYGFVGGIEGIRVYARDPGTGLLASVGPTPTSRFPTGWAFAPDGRHLYFNDFSGIRRFARDPGTGALTLLGSPVGDALRRTDFAFDQTGTHLYATSPWGLVETFTRDPVTGDLVRVDVEAEGVDGVVGLSGVEAVAVAPDGAHVYTTSGSYALLVFARNPVTGALTFLAAMPTPGLLRSASDLAMTSDGAQVLVVGREGNLQYGVFVFERDAVTGLLTAAGAVQGGPGGVDGLGIAYRLQLAPDGGSLYIAARSSNALTVLRRAPGTGALSLLELHQLGHGFLGGLIGLVASPDSQHLYAVSPYGTVAAFAFDPADDTLTRVDTELDGIGGSDGFYGGSSVTSSSTMSPDGRHLYVGTATNDPLLDRGIAIFARDVASGTLAFAGTAEPGREIFGLQVSPDGAHVYALYADPPMRYLQPLAREPLSGTLSPAAAPIPFGQCLMQRSGDCYVGSLAISPDGRSAYLIDGAWPVGSVEVFARDPISGALTPIQSYAGARNPRSVLVSPDGLHVYVTTPAGGTPDPSSAITTLRRDPVSGKLNEVDVLRNPVPVLAGVSVVYPDRLLASADGQFVFTTSAWGVAVFRRDAGTGRLGFVQQVAALHPVLGDAVRPDGVLLFAYANAYVPGFPVDRTTTFTALRPRVYCSPAPLPGCRQPLTAARSTLLVRNPGGTRSNLTWKWTNGAATASSDFGDPTTGTGQTLCVYDARPEPRLDMRMPAGAQCGGKPCWTTKGSAQGFRYADRDLGWDGVKAATLTAGADGRASIVLKAKGLNIPFQPGAALPFVPPVRVQLQAETGECWEATFSTAGLNDALQFKARSD